MSPQLRGEVANHENSGWVMSIGFFTQVPVEEQTNLITEIAVMLRSCVYCPSDTVVHEGSPNNVMYIVQVGLSHYYYYSYYTSSYYYNYDSYYDLLLLRPTTATNTHH